MVFHSPVEALEPAGPALGLRRRRRRAAQALPAVSHLSRLRHAGAHAAGQHRRLERRAHVVANRALYREKFARVLPILRRCSTWQRPMAASICGRRRRRRRSLHARAVRAAERDRAARQLPGARHAHGGNPGAGCVRISLVARVERMRAGRRAAHSRLHCLASRNNYSDHDLTTLRRDHRSRLRTPRRDHARTMRRRRCARRSRTASSCSTPARPASPRKATAVAGQRVAEEGRAAVFPRQRQPAHRRRLHALLRQGAAEVSPTSDDGRSSAPAACAWCRPPSRAAAPTSRPTSC